MHSGRLWRRLKGDVFQALEDAPIGVMSLPLRTIFAPPLVVLVSVFADRAHIAVHLVILVLDN
jgi:hypothetical protein